MTRYREKQLYKKLLKVIEIPPFGRKDLNLKQVIRFYARFLGMYVSKMKKDWVKLDRNFHGTGMKQRIEDQKNLQAIKD
jgi:hypothetical protein